MQILIRCDQPSSLAARLFKNDELVEARLHDDRHGLFVKTRNPDRFYLLLNQIVATDQLTIESIAPVDDDLSAVYEYLIGVHGFMFGGGLRPARSYRDEIRRAGARF